VRLNGVVLVLALALAGCASTPVAPKASEATSPPKVPAPEQPAVVQPVTSPTPPPPAAQSLPRPAPAPARASKPPLRPELPAGEERRLIEEATRQIDDVERLFRELDGRPLKPPQQEVLLTAKNLLAEAKSALGARDYHRAANLASKARTLSDDLASSTK
jgi:hypothetical protein